MRNPRRTASTAAALMIGLGLVAMVAVLAASLKASFDATLQRTLRADFTLSTSSSASFSTDVAARIRDLPELGTVAEFRQGGFRVNGDTAFLSAVEPTAVDQVLSLDVQQGSLADLSGDTVMVHERVAADNGWSVGDEVPAAFATVGERPLRIVGIYGENALVGDYVIALSTYEKLFTENLDVAVMVKTGPGVEPAAASAAITQALHQDFPSIQVQDQAQYRASQAQLVNQLLGLVTALLAMSIVIALFGIVNTLGLSIYERTRELGLLRAVGMGKTQVKRMIRYESVIIALFGAFLGIVVGIGFGWALQQALAPQGVTELRVPVGQLIVYLLFAAFAGVLAAIVPARRAAKIDVLRAVSYE
jgi:putative ABC transport system permease protein